MHRGHAGICYQATASTYLGWTEARTIRLLPDGTVLNDRAIQKIRAREQGWRYAVGLLERFGAEPAPCDGCEDWLKTWLPRLTRRLRHTGNHKYAWALARSARRFLPDSLPYPKHGGLVDDPSVFIVGAGLDSRAKALRWWSRPRSRRPSEAARH
jgi:hypothetical protein